MVAAGDIYRCNFGNPIGHEARLHQRAVVVSPAKLNRPGICIVLLVTRARRGYPTHIELEGALPVTSYIQCELIRAVSTQRLVSRLRPNCEKMSLSSIAAGTFPQVVIQPG